MVMYRMPEKLPPTQEFVPPIQLNCGVAGCDNAGIIIFDPLNGIGISNDISVYPVGIPPELMYSPENTNIQGVVTDTVGASSEAIDASGNVRELQVGSVIYKGDILIVGPTSCLSMKDAAGEKKWFSDTKHHPAPSHECKLKRFNNVVVGYKSTQHKNNNLVPRPVETKLLHDNTAPYYSFGNVLSMMKNRV